MERRLILVPLLVALLSPGCQSWQIVDQRSRLDVETAIHEENRVRVTTGERRQEIKVIEISYPFIDGELIAPKESAGDFVSVNLRRVDLLEVRLFGPSTVWLGVLVAVGLFAVLIASLGSSDGSIPVSPFGS